MFLAVMFQANFSRLYYGIFRLTSFYSLLWMNIHVHEISHERRVMCVLKTVLGAHLLGPINNKVPATPADRLPRV